MIKEKFVERYQEIAGPGFRESLAERMPMSFRVNTLKARRDDIVEKLRGYGFDINQAEWYEDAFTSSHPVSKTLEYFMGHIYIQELASMMPPLIAREELIEAVNVLDACAAPGSKATQIATMLRSGILFANDSDFSRLRALKFNMEKAGATNTIITNNDLRRMTGSFDLIFLDAPCSAEGTVRKNRKAMEMWSEKRIERSANIQKQLILKAFDMLEEGGTLVYSTCTFAPEENEGILEYLLKKKDAKIERVKIKNFKTMPGITEWKGKSFDGSVKKAVRIWPQLNNTAGFFVAKMRR